jgi:hypothetical protein
MKKIQKEEELTKRSMKSEAVLIIQYKDTGVAWQRKRQEAHYSLIAAAAFNYGVTNTFMIMVAGKKVKMLTTAMRTLSGAEASWCLANVYKNWPGQSD